MSLEVALRHRLGGFALDVAFRAPRGVTALFGPSGAGKSTVIAAIAGLLRPDQGRVVVEGETLTHVSAGVFVPPARRRVGCVFQEGRLFPHLSARGNLLFGRRFAPRGAAGPELDEVVALLGIGHLLARRPGDLSGGERQRVAIGRALLAKPRLLLMDEPLAALDVARKAEILPFLERLRDAGGPPIVYVSHSVEEVARLATTVVTLAEGRVVRVGPPAETPPRAGGDAGPAVLLEARVEGRGAEGLAALAAAGGRLHLATAAPAGARLRLRVRARDVILAPSGAPHGAENALAATVLDLSPPDAEGARLVGLRAGEDRLLARVGPLAAARLRLAPGLAVQALVTEMGVEGAVEPVGHSAQNS